MSGKERDVIQVHSCSFQDGTALVTQRMRRQCWKPHFFPYPFHNFIKSANGERAAWVTRGLRKKIGPRSPPSLAAMRERGSPSRKPRTRCKNQAEMGTYRIRPPFVS